MPAHQGDLLVSEEIGQLIRNTLRPLYPALLECRSTAELHELPAFVRHRDDFARALETVQHGSFATSVAPSKERYRVVAWNLERGKQLAGQIDVLRNHPYLRTADVLLLTETDVGMARSGNTDVARTLAAELGMHYGFVPCYLSLVKGSGIERDVEGENDLGLHGNAILSRYPLSGLRPIHLRNGIDKVASREKRLGSQTALAAVVEFPQAAVPMVSIHLDANSSQTHRAEQMRGILDALAPSGTALIGGDWNTTTFNSSSAFRAIMGYFLRVLMGPGRVIRNHYLHPYRWFERRLFGLLEERGFDYRGPNLEAEYTIYYSVEDLSAHKGLAEWIPGWCFPFIRWALREHNGRCPLKIDWFASRELRCHDPVVIHDVREGRPVPLSDHDAIGVDIAVA